MYVCMYVCMYVGMYVGKNIIALSITQLVVANMRQFEWCGRSGASGKMPCADDVAMSSKEVMATR